MKLISAYGGSAMQNATKNYIVHEIASIMFDHVDDRNFFMNAASFLREYEVKTASHFAIKLDALRRYGQIRADGEGRFITPFYALDLASSFEKLYSQPEDTIKYQRGAIVELLTLKLVNSRCDAGECLGNHRFVYERNSRSTDQVDVAVLAKRRQQIEAYTCKIKSIGLTSVDCTNLTDLIQEAQEQYYDIHTGAVCFENSYKIEQRLRDFSTPSIKAYGIDNITKLRTNPF